MGVSWAQFFGGVSRVVPLISMFGGPAAPIAIAVSRAILNVERASTDPGATKRAKAVEIVASLVEGMEGVAGRDIVSNPLVHEAVLSVIDAEGALRNAHMRLEQGGVDVQAKRAAPAVPPEPPQGLRSPASAGE